MNRRDLIKMLLVTPAVPLVAVGEAESKPGWNYFKARACQLEDRIEKLREVAKTCRAESAAGSFGMTYAALFLESAVRIMDGEESEDPGVRSATLASAHSNNCLGKIGATHINEAEMTWHFDDDKKHWVVRQGRSKAVVTFDEDMEKEWRAQQAESPQAFMMRRLEEKHEAKVDPVADIQGYWRNQHGAKSWDEFNCPSRFSDGVTVHRAWINGKLIGGSDA